MRYFLGRDLSGYLVPPELVETFARGWAQSRGVEPPTPDGTALRIETGQPHEIRRYIFPRPPAGIDAVAAHIARPLVLLKAPMDAAAMAGQLPPHWHVEQTGTTMTASRLPDTACAPPDGLRLDAEWRGPVYFARIVGADGGEAARGRLTVIDGWALHDTIQVAENQRRRGLGTVVMATLGVEARRQGVTRGLLTATVAGRALYETMGWTARAPWTTAQIRP